MKTITRFLSLLLLATPLAARAVPFLSISEKWSELGFFDYTGNVHVMYTNGSASMMFSGFKMTNAGPISGSTQFSVMFGDVYITVPLSGDNSDPDNPIISSYRPGKTHATFRFSHNLGYGNYFVDKTLRLSWDNNILSGIISGPPGTFVFKSFMTPQTNGVSSATCLFSFGNYSGKLRYDYKFTNSVTISAPYVSMYGSFIGTSRFQSPTVTITSPAPNISTTNPVLQLTGVNTAFNGTGPTMWRWAAPTDDPSLDPELFTWNTVDDPGTLQTKRTLWSTSTQLEPGTNWFWAMTSDSIGNPSPIATRKFFYSVRSRLTLDPKGDGTITGGKGVTNGAMLEIGRGYTVTARATNTNSIFRDWRDHDFNILSTANPYTFLMQSNAFIAANFIRNPFPAIAGTYSGIFTDPDNPATVRNSGYITFTVKADGAYSGTVLYDVQKLPFSGKLQFDIDDPFFNDPDAVNSVFIAGRGPLEGELRFPSDGSGHLLPTPTIRIDAIRNGVWYPVLPALPFERSSTNAVPPGLYNITDQPGGYTVGFVGSSYGSVTVNNGQANILLFLADGSKPVSFSTPVRENGRAAFFIPLYGGKGMVMGDIDLLQAGNTRGSFGNWTRPANARSAMLPEGVVRGLDFSVYKFALPAGESVVTGFGVGKIAILTAAHTYVAQFVYSPSNHQFVALPVADQSGLTSMKLMLAPTTGLISGTVTFNGHPTFIVNALVSTSTSGFSLDTHNSAGVFFGRAPTNSLGYYDDGFVLPDQYGGIEDGVAATAYFSFTSTSQLRIPGPAQLTIYMHKAVQLAPHQQSLITDTFKDVLLSDPHFFVMVPEEPYTGLYDPGVSGFPAITIDPIDRMTEYIAN